MSEHGKPYHSPFPPGVGLVGDRGPELTALPRPPGLGAARITLALDERGLPEFMAGFTGQTAARAADQDARPAGYVVAGGVAVLPIHGSLYLHGYQRITDQLAMALRDPAVGAVLLDINSFGGQAAGMFQASQAIRAMRGDKPIWAVANLFALSAAYGLASAADRVLVSPDAAAGVGSVGVIAVHASWAGLFEEVGIDHTVFRSPEPKADGNPYERLEEGPRARLQAEIEQLYGDFTGLVAGNRAMAEKDVIATQAAVLPGQAAVDAGLADDVTTFDAALAALSRAVAGDGPSRSTLSMSKETDMTIKTKEALPAATTPPGTPEATPPDMAAIEAAAEAKAAEKTAANAKAIGELCDLAGLPTLAAGFIGKGLSADQVRTELLNARADAADKVQVSGLHTGEPPAANATPAPIDNTEVYARLNASEARFKEV